MGAVVNKLQESAKQLARAREMVQAATAAGTVSNQQHAALATAAWEAECELKNAARTIETLQGLNRDAARMIDEQRQQIARFEQRGGVGDPESPYYEVEQEAASLAWGR